MMICVWVLQITFILAGFFIAQGNGSINPRLESWIKNCQTKTGASDSDYQLIKMRKIPLSPEGVCMVECLFTKLHIVEHGQFNRHGFVITFSPAVKDDLKKISKLKEIASICDNEINATESREECDTTKMVLDCFARNKDKLDLAKTS